MTQPCIVVATFRPVEGKTKELLALLESVIPQVHEEEGCELYSLHLEVGGKLFMIEKWTTRELWQRHNDAPSVATIRASLPGLILGDVMVEEMYGHPVGDKLKGSF